MNNKFLIVLIGLVAFGAYACGGGGGMSAEMPVAEAKALNESLTSSYGETDASWQAAKENAGQVGQLSDVDVSSLDIDGIKGTLEECFNAPIETVEAGAEKVEEGAKDTAEGKSAQKEAAATKKIALAGYDTVKACPGATEDSITGYTANADDQSGALKAAKVQQIDQLRKDLLYILPTNYKTLAEEAPAAIAEVAEIRGRAEAALKAAEANPLASAEEKSKAKSDYDAVIADLDSIEALANKIKDDATAKPEELKGLADQIVNDIKNFGVVEEGGS